MYVVRGAYNKLIFTRAMKRLYQTQSYILLRNVYLLCVCWKIHENSCANVFFVVSFLFLFKRLPLN